MPIKPGKLGRRPRAVALDLGSTRFKVALLDEEGQLFNVRAAPAPALTGTGLIREAPANEFLEAANRLLSDLHAELGSVPLGLVCQRSSFTVWERSSGHAVTPVVSWQDRRAESWCREHPELEALVQAKSGLRLSPHYMGPKLAMMQTQDASLAGGFEAGELLAGTLDAWLIWNWTTDRRHLTDVSMGSRTALMDIAAGDWSTSLLDVFSIPKEILPMPMPTHCDEPLEFGWPLRASIADQAASALTVLDPSDDVALVNFGTGAFVLMPAADPTARRDGYLMAPILGPAGGERACYVLEGTINGAGPAVDRFGHGPTSFPTRDVCPDGFVIPDLNGLGSPHWRADFSLTMSNAVANASAGDQRRCVLEGLLFRVREILSDLGHGSLPGRVLISGGLTQDPGVGAGMADLLGQPVYVLEEHESTLLGTARIAAGLDPFANPLTRLIEPATDSYLPGKYSRWRTWMQQRLSANEPPGI